MAGKVKHCAKWSDPVLDEIRCVLDAFGTPARTLDPFGGVGKIHLLDLPFTVDVELEWEWASAPLVDSRKVRVPRVSVQGDTHDLPFPTGSFDGLISSPVYYNRMSDSHHAQERCRACKAEGCEKCEFTGRRKHHRNTYTHTLGRTLTKGNAGAVQWGPRARQSGELLLRECWRVLAPEGLIVWNASDHIRGGEVQDVTGWYRDTWIGLGAVLIDEIDVSTDRLPDGANWDVRVPTEKVFTFRRPGVTQ